MKIITEDNEDVIRCVLLTNKVVSGVEDCKSEATLIGSNAFDFNIDKESCWFKSCSDDDLEISSESFGPQYMYTDIYSC